MFPVGEMEFFCFFFKEREAGGSGLPAAHHRHPAAQGHARQHPRLRPAQGPGLLPGSGRLPAREASTIISPFILIVI